MFSSLCFLALIVVEILEAPKAIFSGRKERPAEAPFLALKKKLLE
jgi:hypothetical protein